MTMNLRGYAAPSAKAALVPYQFERRDTRADDVVIDILYCGICHSDLHNVNNDLGLNSVYPITKYLESNKDRITDLSNKNYENLVERLTNNVINTAVVAASSSSNLSLSQPQSSSSTFSNSFDQIDSFRKEESENYHNNSKGDIAD